jgi:hypothetical protein
MFVCITYLILSILKTELFAYLFIYCYLNLMNKDSKIRSRYEINKLTFRFVMIRETAVDGQDAGAGDECHHFLTVIMIAVTPRVHCHVSVWYLSQKRLCSQKRT